MVIEPTQPAKTAATPVFKFKKIESKTVQLVLFESRFHITCRLNSEIDLDHSEMLELLRIGGIHVVC